MTSQIYRVLEVIGSEKPVLNINIPDVKIFNIFITDLDVFLFMNGLDIKYKNGLDIKRYNFRTVSLYLITQRLKIYLLNNFSL